MKAEDLYYTLSKFEVIEINTGDSIENRIKHIYGEWPKLPLVIPILGQVIQLLGPGVQLLG